MRVTEEVQACFSARADYFEQYFIVPADVQNDVDAFIAQAAALGESCANATEFEKGFVSSGLSDRFAAVLAKCTPKAQKMTREDRKKALQTTKDILRESKDELAQDAVTKIVDRASTQARGDLAERMHKQRIADGTDAEYTIRSNQIGDIGRAIRFLGDIFKKK